MIVLMLPRFLSTVFLVIAATQVVSAGVIISTPTDAVVSSELVAASMNDCGDQPVVVRSDCGSDLASVPLAESQGTQLAFAESLFSTYVPVLKCRVVGVDESCPRSPFLDGVLRPA